MPTSRFIALLGAGIADLDVIVERDPSVRSRTEALLHPALPAVWSHRAAHALHGRGRRRLARALSTLTRLATGVEIHPGARIGRRFFIDHGCGVVIGETAVIGDDVTLFHQVTLGAVGWWHDRQRPQGARRHPQLGDGVVVGANATVLGAVSIGPRAVVGAQALVLSDVPPGARMLAPKATPSPQTSASPLAPEVPLMCAVRQAAPDHDGHDQLAVAAVGNPRAERTPFQAAALPGRSPKRTGVRSP